jgi:hypothetical protein
MYPDSGGWLGPYVHGPVLHIVHQICSSLITAGLQYRMMVRCSITSTSLLLLRTTYSFGRRRAPFFSAHASFAGRNLAATNIFLF